VEPDAYFILQHAELPEGKNRKHFFLEADRGTMTHERIGKKLRAYRAYYDEGKFTQKFPGMVAFNVLAVTETRRRAEELRNDPDLRALIPTAPLQRAYRFLALEELALETLSREPPKLDRPSAPPIL